MPVLASPPVPYPATALRPAWRELPAAVRRAVERRLGSPVLGATQAGGGFTAGFAAVVEAADGGTAFVKAASDAIRPVAAAGYRREAAVVPALPEEVPAPRLRWSTDVGDWIILGFDAVPGRMPLLPWDPAELDAVLRAWDGAAAALRPAPEAMLAIGLRSVAAEFGEAFTGWRSAAAGDAPPRVPLAAGRVGALAGLEAAWADACAGDAVIHGDLRLDNVLLDDARRAWVCDWNRPCLAAPWVDVVTLLVSASASGLDVDRLLVEHPTAAGVAPERVDSLLAALAGFWLREAQASRQASSPYLRHHQRWTGEAALGWLARRRGWR